MKTYNALSKSFTDEIKTIMGVGKSIDDAFIEVKLDITRSIDINATGIMILNFTLIFLKFINFLLSNHNIFILQ